MGKDAFGSNYTGRWTGSWRFDDEMNQCAPGDQIIEAVHLLLCQFGSLWDVMNLFKFIQFIIAPGLIFLGNGQCD